MKKTIRIIDLLNKIANGEEVPRKFTYKGYLWEYDIKNEMWFYYFGEDKSHRFDRLFYLHMCLNDEVEIIEEDKEEFEDIESFGVHYSWDYIDYKNIEELKKYVNKDFQNIFDTLDKLIKNQNKIIEKLKNI